MHDVVVSGCMRPGSKLSPSVDPLPKQKVSNAREDSALLTARVSECLPAFGPIGTLDADLADPVSGNTALAAAASRVQVEVSEEIVTGRFVEPAETEGDAKHGQFNLCQAPWRLLFQ